MQPAISIQGLSKRYRIRHGQRARYATLRDSLAGLFTAPFRRGAMPATEDIWALKDVSLDIQQGERIGIIGRNGAGKSTLLKLLSRITTPTEGTATIRGRVASLLEVGTGFHPELTGRENIFLNGAVLGMSRAEIRAKFDEIVAFAEVERFLDTPVKRYSSGMQVRLAFAVAAHLEPEILLVDEVLAVGDAAFQKRCLGKMEEVSRGEGRTVVFVSHNLGAIESLCGRGVVLEDGQVAFCGSSSDAVAGYLTSAHARSVEAVSERRDHTGDGRVRVEEIRYGLPGGRLGEYWQTGQDCVVEFCYTSTLPAGSRVDVGFSLEDSGGKKLFFANTVVGRQALRIQSPRGTVRCLLRGFPLSPGRYFMTYDVYANGRLLDRMDSAREVLVEASDGSGTWQAWGGYATACCSFEWDSAGAWVEQ